MENKQLVNATLYSGLLMILTSVHHVYGALIYATPWRMNVLYVSIPILILTTLLYFKLRSNRVSKTNPVFWGYWIITLVIPLSMIGLFEGVYNHILKVILFYGGAGLDTLTMLFPPPKYKLPNDALFEITGVFQGIIVLPLLLSFIRITKLVLKS